jgi:hypothetical protein
MTHPLLARRRRRWPFVAAAVVLILLAAGWSAAWFYAADIAGNTIDGWFAREIQAGRTYSCGSRTIGGFPFRIEVNCTPASMDWRSSEPTVFVKTTSMLMTAQVYQPTLINSTFTGPLTLTDPSKDPTKAPVYVANWESLRTSVRGGPVLPDRVSILMDKPVFSRAGASGGEPLFKAERAEVQGRIVEGSAAGNPVIDIVLRTKGATAPTINPLAAQPFDSDITFTLRGLKDFGPKPWPDRFREIQAAGGRIDITRARVQQDTAVGIATGTLSLSAAGRLNGELLVTVAGLERIISAFGLERFAGNSGAMDRVAGALDRFSPGLGNLARERAGPSIAAGIGLLGTPTQLEGKSAVVLPLRFREGAMFLGALPVGQVNPLF